jgi:PAS domain S-box-containing protein
VSTRVPKKKQATQQHSPAELAYQDSEPPYHAIWEAASDAMVLSAPDGTVISANPAYFRLHGYAPEAILGKNFSVVFQQDQRAQAQKSYHAAFQNPVITPRFETAIVSADGAEHIIEISYNFLTHNSTRTAMISTIRDITAFKRLEQQQETLESLTIAADAIAQGIGRKWAEEQLEEHVQQRTRELSLLLAIAQTVASTLEWKPLLSIILEQLKTAVDYDSAILYSAQASQLAMLAYQGPQPQSLIERLAQIFEQGPIYEQICLQREPLIISDLHNFPQFVQAYLQELGEPADTAYDQFRAWMGVPLIVRERVIGMLTLTHHLPDVYTPRHANLAFAMANQVAVALENADLYKQARVLAALQERQHLSRELHSSLSREMFGIRLSAQHAREALAAGVYHEALAPIDRVIQYVEAGLAVMRALIFELRPDSLRSEGLVAALENLAAVVRTRYQLPIEAFLGKEPRLTLESKQALYRIAQEALQNVVKHSRALAVTLRLAQEDQEVALEVRDDGRGFDPNRPINRGQGLQIMRGQIAPLGGTFTLVSAPGHGTSIIVRLPQHS